MNSIAPAVGPKTAVLPILNGVNHIDMLAERFGAHSIVGGVTQFLVNQADDGTIQETLHGAGGQKTILGEILSGASQRCASILHEMKKTMPDTAISDNILKELWAKISGAGASFAVASLLHARAGKVAAASAGNNVVAGIFEECAAICLAEGYPPPDGTRDMLLNDLWGKRNSDYGPSLLADIENGRPTEGEHVVGDLVRRPKKFKIKIPLLEACLCRIQIYESELQKL
jgi:2-dehydropantoate 2-reductase